MKQVVFLLFGLIIIGCGTTPEEKQHIQQLNAEINEAIKGVRVIPYGAANWCELELARQCKFLGSQGCLAKAEGKEEACIRRIKTAGVKLGGDHVVITLAEVKPDVPEQTRYNGDVYQCSDTYTGLSQRVIEAKPTTSLKPYRWLSKDYAGQCNVAGRCNQVTEFKCTTLRNNQSKRCYSYIIQKQVQPLLESINTLAYEHESFEDDGARDQIRLRYNISGMMYQCPHNQ